MWAYESVFYQIYPLGFCGAPFENDGIPESRIRKVNDWIPHMIRMAIIRGIIIKLTVVLEPTRILREFAGICMKTASK